MDITQVGDLEKEVFIKRVEILGVELTRIGDHGDLSRRVYEAAIDFGLDRAVHRDSALDGDSKNPQKCFRDVDGLYSFLRQRPDRREFLGVDGTTDHQHLGTGRDCQLHRHGKAVGDHLKILVPFKLER